MYNKIFFASLFLLTISMSSDASYNTIGHSSSLRAPSEFDCESDRESPIPDDPIVVIKTQLKEDFLNRIRAENAAQRKAFYDAQQKKGAVVDNYKKLYWNHGYKKIKTN